MKVLHNILFIFHFIWPVLPCKWKTSYRKSRYYSVEKPKKDVTKISNEPGIRIPFKDEIITKNTIWSFFVLKGKKKMVYPNCEKEDYAPEGEPELNRFGVIAGLFR